MFLNLVSLITLPKNGRQELKMGCTDASRRQLQSVLKIGSKLIFDEVMAVLVLP
jgi:hypothetical protein